MTTENKNEQTMKPSVSKHENKPAENKPGQTQAGAGAAPDAKKPEQTGTPDKQSGQKPAASKP